ncbi:PaaI family thioesterase [Blastomonas fulva]|uniref:Chemotaxis protein n=1 Tax=Blastomonas fulva TaxID=1550728 RepID=A0ABM6MCE1_9SPHN|nr:PaaI family thioesterase [Blastomonas fulva]ASR53670.1 chemotaxis protein [Blastomonas fulva]
MNAQTTSFAGDLAFEATLVSPGEASGTMPIGPGLLNPFGTVHAGAMVWFADVVATTLALQGQRPEPGMKGFPLAINLSANLLSNSREGHLHARARFVKQGRRVSTVSTEVTSDDGKLLLVLTTTHVAAEG